MSKLDKIFKIVSAKFPALVSIEHDECFENPEDDYINFGDVLSVYADGSAFKFTFYRSTRDEPEDVSINPIGVIGDSAKSVEAIASAFIALIEKEIAVQKADAESDKAYAEQLDNEKKLLEDKQLWADLDYERNWSWREEDFGTAAQDAYDRGW
jgi:hypothetical protein